MTSSRSRRAAGALATLSVVGLLAGCTDDEPQPDRRGRARDGTRTRSSEALEWRGCDGGECARLAVPRDYDEPDGPEIEVALFRLPASDRDRRIGSLLVNPGGPGASGVDFVRDNGFFFPSVLRERFDLVGFDPRGTGGTIPVTCADSLDEVLSFDYSPDSSDERARLEQGIQELTEGCEQRSGEVLPYIASQDTARDMDRVREAVGDEKLTYLGFSYGTYLGALYADMFPGRVRALLLDGAVDPELDALDANLQQAAGFEQALTAFLDDCARDDDCEFHNDGDPHAAYDQLAARVESQPLPAGEGRRLGPNEFAIGVANVLYQGEAGWPALAEALTAAADGDGDLLMTEFDQYSGRREDGSYDSLLEPFWAIGCVDGEPIGPPDGYPALEDEFREAAPRFGVTFLYSALVCSYWPVDVAPDPRPLDGTGADPIVVVGTSGDPATPFSWAESLASVLESGVLVAAEGEQHTSFLDDECVTEIGLRYLVELVVPEDGARCG